MNTSSSGAKRSRARGKSPGAGWAAFDLKQRQKQGLVTQVVSQVPFPPLSTFPSLRPCGNLPTNNVFSSRSLSSVSATTDDYGLVDAVKGHNPDFAFNQLIQLHNWADKRLIEDVMASVNNDIDKSAILLTQMASAEDNGGKKCISDQRIKDENESALLGKTSELAAEIADLSSILEDALKDNDKEMKDVHAASGQGPSKAAAANMKLILGHLKSLPVEPEWEEHDIYLSYRRNALKMMRLASRHSRAATNAFLRGDHFSAQKHSQRAHKEWMDAERLNAKAAKEILGMRNSETNQWKLDLHGLHVAEAVQALQEHLEKIEIQLPMNRSVSPFIVSKRIGICSLHEPFSRMDVENLGKQQIGFSQRAASLQVITGVGNHSRGQAALPAAVRSFLNENRYQHDEARPGVIIVHPKFRNK